MRAFSRICFIVATFLLFIATYRLYNHYIPSSLSFTNYNPTHKKAYATKIVPTYIRIKDIDIETPIYPARITKKKWETTDKGASYILSTATPGTEGNAIFYGHNWPRIFGNLTKVKPGSYVEVTLSDASVKKYVVENTAIVSPSQVDVLAQSVDQRLTLYTCTGFFDRNRFVATARIIN